MNLIPILRMIYYKHALSARIDIQSAGGTTALPIPYPTQKSWGGVLVSVGLNEEMAEEG